VSPINGSEVEDFLSSGGDFLDFEIDPLAGDVYWSDNGQNGIWRVDHVGANVESVLSWDGGVFVGQSVGFDILPSSVIPEPTAFIVWSLLGLTALVQFGNGSASSLTPQSTHPQPGFRAEFSFAPVATLQF
jgi:hypothetical protein